MGVDDEIKEFALDSHVVELYNYYVSTNNVVKVYVEVQNGGGKKVTVVGNEDAQGGNEVVVESDEGYSEYEEGDSGSKFEEEMDVLGE